MLNLLSEFWRKSGRLAAHAPKLPVTPDPVHPDPAGRKDLFRAALLRAIDQICGQIGDDVRAALYSEIVLVDLPVGATLYSQGDVGDCMHIVLSGRLLVSVRDGDGARVLARPQPGDVVGEVALIAGNPRAATVVAHRHTTLAMLGRAAIDAVVGRHPEVSTNLARLVVDRLTNRRGHIGERKGAHTFLILPVGSPGPDMGAVARAFSTGLRPYGTVLWLNSPAAEAKSSAEGSLEHGRWFDECERQNDFVFLEADDPAIGRSTPWSEHCFGHADKILLIANADSPATIGAADLWLTGRLGGSNPHAVPCELILLHREGVPPKGTRAWTAPRYLGQHYHLHVTDPKSVSRMGRQLAGRSVSLVLAGGGARGFAHLGVLRAMRDVGVPVDSAGGSSFGALAASGPARGMTWEELYEEEHTAFSFENPLGDYTFPAVSLVSGAHLERLLRKYMPMDIEDLPLPFFAVSSDLSANAAHIHDAGPLWAAIRASVSLPGILPPVVHEGNLLVDGAILNNFPSDVMRQRQPGLVIGVDLTERQEFRHHQVALPSGLEYLRSLLPWRRRVDSPMILSIIMRGLTLAGRRPLSEKAASVDLFMNPPMDAYGLLDWARLQEIEQVGYDYARPLLEAWLAEHPELKDTEVLSK